MKIRSFTTLCMAFAFVAFMATTAMSQTVYHLKLVYETQPTMANETFYVRLVLVEHTINVGSYQLLVGFDQSMGHLIANHNNLPGGGSSGAMFGLNSGEAPLSGVPYADTGRQITLETSSAIEAPFDPNADFNIGRLEFLTSPTYSSAQGQFGIYLTADGSMLGFFDGNVDPVLVESISLDPTSAVADWAIY